MLAAVGTGFYSDLSVACNALSLETNLIEPNEVAVYRDRYAQFTRLYPLLKQEMNLITLSGGR